MTPLPDYPIFILIDDGDNVPCVNDYWKTVIGYLQVLSNYLVENNHSGYQILFINHNIHNFTERVHSPKKVQHLMNFSPRGQAYLGSKLRDLFYSLTDKGKSLVLVITPDTSQLQKLANFI